MHVILGASGNTGHVAAQNLLARGEKVRVVARKPEQLQPLAAQGAEIFTADITDTSAITKALTGAGCAYVHRNSLISTSVRRWKTCWITMNISPPDTNCFSGFGVLWCESVHAISATGSRTRKLADFVRS